MNILILGGYGYTGQSLSRHLMAETQNSLIIAGRHLDRASTLVAALNTPRAIARKVDARDRAALVEALRGVDLLLVASPTTHAADVVVGAALEAGVDYLDVQLSDSKLQCLRAHEAEIKSKGLCFVTEAGFHPGLPAALVRYAASSVECIESALIAAYLGIGGDLPYTEAVDELMESFLNYRAQVLKDGRWTKPGAYDIRRFDFGVGIGRRDCYSMFFEELQALPEMLPTLKNVGFYMASMGWFADALSMLVLLGLKISPRRGLRPLGRLMWWAMTKMSAPPHRIVLQVEGSGQVAGRPARFRIRLEHADGYEFTAIPVVALLMQYNEIRSPGLHMMGHLCDPRRLVTDMRAMGVGLTEALE